MCSGYLHLFNPVSTTFVKHFIARVTHMQDNITVHMILLLDIVIQHLLLTQFRFKMNSGNIDAGDICLYGISIENDYK